MNEKEEPLKKKIPKKRKASSPKRQISAAEETPASPSAAVVEEILKCWGPSASEGPQKQDLTVFLEYNV
jgi:hypothetical protein